MRAFRQAPWRTQTQSVAAWSISLLIIAVVGGLYLTVASRAGTAGRDLQRLEARKVELAQANDELRAQLAELRSVTRLSNRARELGFQPAQPEEIDYLAVNNYPPAAESGAPVASPGAAPATRTASSGGWLSDVLRSLASDGG